MHVSVSGLRAQKSTFFGPGPALDFSRNGLRRRDACMSASAEINADEKGEGKRRRKGDRCQRAMHADLKDLCLTPWASSSPPCAVVAML